MQAVNKAYEWLILYDFLNVDILSRQEWSLMKYIPYLFVTFHLLFSCISPPRIQFPHAAQEVCYLGLLNAFSKSTNLKDHFYHINDILFKQNISVHFLESTEITEKRKPSFLHV